MYKCTDCGNAHQGFIIELSKPPGMRVLVEPDEQTLLTDYYKNTKDYSCAACGSKYVEYFEKTKYSFYSSDLW